MPALALEAQSSLPNLAGVRLIIGLMLPSLDAPVLTKIFSPPNSLTRDDGLAICLAASADRDLCALFGKCAWRCAANPSLPAGDGDSFPTQTDP